MANFHTIKYQNNSGAARITLHRPEVKNAINMQMISELTNVFDGINDDATVKMAVIEASGDTFCAGIDFKWMLETHQKSPDEIYQENLELAGMFKSIYDCNKPVISMIQGPAFGGANGIIATTDIVIAMETSYFALPELKFGLAPSTIMPFLLLRMKQSDINNLYFGQDNMNVTKAQAAGLVDIICQTGDHLQATVQSFIEKLTTANMQAFKKHKEQLRAHHGHIINKQVMDQSVQNITELRTSNEARKRMENFVNRKIKIN